MRLKRPQEATLDEVTITRSGEDAIIAFHDKEISTTHLKIGPEIEGMSDEQVLDTFNLTIAAMQKMAEEYEHVAVEIPPGIPQIEYFKGSGQWVPRGDVLRCFIEDGGPDDEAVVHIDEQELSMHEFGRLLTTHAGWGMRITFVPEDDLTKIPEVEVKEPEDENFGNEGTGPSLRILDK